MKKKKPLVLGLLCAALLISILFSAGSMTAFASDGESLPQTEIMTTEEEEKQSKLDQAIAFFNDKILPVILSLGGAGIAAAVGMPVVLRKIGKANRKASDLKSQLDKTTTALRLLDAQKEALKTREDYTEVITEGIKNSLILPVTALQSAQADTDRRIDILVEEVTALRRGASIAWTEAPGAVEALAVSATNNALRRRDLENIRLKEALRKAKGDEAEKEIADIAEAVAHE